METLLSTIIKTSFHTCQKRREKKRRTESGEKKRRKKRIWEKLFGSKLLQAIKCICHVQKADKLNLSKTATRQATIAAALTAASGVLCGAGSGSEWAGYCMFCLSNI